MLMRHRPAKGSEPAGQPRRWLEGRRYQKCTNPAKQPQDRGAVRPGRRQRKIKGKEGKSGTAAEGREKRKNQKD